MKIIRIKDVEIKEAKDVPMFTGGKVHVQFLLDEKTAKDIHVGLVRFGPGARTKFHTHTSEQVLYVTEGKGVVATEDKEVIVESGTVVYIPQGEKHWHGATQNSSFAHIAVLQANANAIIEE